MQSTDDIHEHLKRVLAELFEVDPAKVRLEARLYEDLDIDSIDAIDLMLKLKETTGRKIQPEEFRHVRTVADIVETVRAMLADSSHVA
ncbi:acyl carrier protein [Nevskia sp.]|uniref:acyl carrier protein n=1 Tax=Nevskia sp. TaxID=1929292 RepID=UPI0025F25F46|nr:acyl carrier protein [Nevskia sp.]